VTVVASTSEHNDNRQQEQEMTDDSLDFLKKRVADALMADHGFVHDPAKYDIEFDPDDPDSQYSMVWADASIAVDTFIEALLDLGDEALEEEEPEPEPSDEPRSPFDNPSIRSSNTTFIFLDPGDGNPRYVGDVRDWLAIVDGLKIPDSTEIEGSLHLDYDIKPASYVQAIDCGECEKDDVLVGTHNCQEGA